MKKPFLFFSFFVLLTCTLQAQDTLPKFSVRNVGNNRIIIGWTNNFRNIKQISIQRSFDSLTNFKTILTVPDPTTPQNGYLDTKATNDHMFYRLYILLDRGYFIFSQAKKPIIDTFKKEQNALVIDLKRLIIEEQIEIPKLETIADTIAYLRKMDLGGKFDMLLGKDTLRTIDQNLKNKIRPDVFVPSKYVSTYKNGYVRVNLPDDDKKYNIKFFEDDGSFLFELKDIKEKTFSIDKANFYHAGWFKFELYGDGKLIEKHKFYLEKEF
jgi:hypothetical protein